MNQTRVNQLADRIQVIVAEMLERRVKDPRLGFVTVTEARLTGDLREATVFYTVLGGDQDHTGTAVALESAKGPDPLRGRPSAGAAAHAEPDLHRRRRTRERPAHRGPAAPGP